uniref:Uncharacterized protein n=1 Tax=Arundo donax TaxID=35708 RepID=A0A0A8Z3N2_ARUDO
MFFIACSVEKQKADITTTETNLSISTYTSKN